MLHPTPLEEEVERVKQEAEAQAKQAAEDAIKQMDAQRQKAQEDADKSGGFSPSDHPVGTSTSGVEATGTTFSYISEASEDADKAKGDEEEEEDEEDSGEDVIKSLLDDRPSYFLPFPDPDGGV